MVTATISKQEFDGIQSEQFIAQAFSGSLPAFLIAFTSRKMLDHTEIDAIQNLLSQIKMIKSFFNLEIDILCRSSVCLNNLHMKLDTTHLGGILF